MSLSHDIRSDLLGKGLISLYEANKQVYLYSPVRFAVRLWHLIWINIFFKFAIDREGRRNIKRTSLQLIERAAIEIKN